MTAVMAAGVNPAQIKAKPMPTPPTLIAGLMAVMALMAGLMAARYRLAMRPLPTMPTLPTDMETSHKRPALRSRRSASAASSKRACPKRGLGELFWPIVIRSTATVRCVCDCHGGRREKYILEDFGRSPTDTKGCGVNEPYRFIKNLQQAIRKPNGRKSTVKDMLVLAPQNDPFYAGNGVEGEKGRWFARLWERFGYGSGTHLRRIHYRLDAQKNILKPDGELYENNQECWNYMQQASRQARYMGLVNPEEVVDRRNPNPRIYMGPGASGWEEIQHDQGWAYEFYGFMLPSLEIPEPSLNLPELSPTGYAYHNAMQRYHVEVWAEKTTMDDILVPLCSQTATNYVSGAGYLSITAMVKLLRQRVHELEKPCRILYVSDFDAAGKNMPRQMARQMQYWIDTYAADCDIRVEPIVMTAEQAREYPEAPDTGAVELDAMEAINPGELERIVRGSIAPFRDPELRTRVQEVAGEAQDALDEEFEDTCAIEL